MPTLYRFEELDVRKRARELANLIYDVTDEGTFARDYDLRDQVRRASVSIMSNIAEGYESRAQALFIEFLGRAKGSAGELRAQLHLAVDRKYLSTDEFSRAYTQTEACSKQLARFIQYLENKPNAKRISDNGVSYDVSPESR